jgi:hypothetical protein
MVVLHLTEIEAAYPRKNVAVPRVDRDEPCLNALGLPPQRVGEFDFAAQRIEGGAGIESPTDERTIPVRLSDE